MKTAIIPLEAGLKASLDWSQQKESAHNLINNGHSILWELRLGLFSELDYTLSDHTQFMSLKLAIDHLKNDIWPLFKENSLGAGLYQGPADYLNEFAWDDQQIENLRGWLSEFLHTCETFNEETALNISDFKQVEPENLLKTPQGKRLLRLFCLDACTGYLNLLAADTPDEIPLFVSLDTTSINNKALLAQLTSTEKYKRFSLYPLSHNSEAKIAFCLPPSFLVRQAAIEGLNEAMEQLTSKCIPYKIIPEDMLISEWDELDVLIVCSNGLGPQGKRKLQGFCAAGGLVATLGTSCLHLVNEMTFEDWLADS
jgi:hypothetical protein